MYVCMYVCVCACVLTVLCLLHRNSGKTWKTLNQNHKTKFKGKEFDCYTPKMEARYSFETVMSIHGPTCFYVQKWRILICIALRTWNVESYCVFLERCWGFYVAWILYARTHSSSVMTPCSISIVYAIFGTSKLHTHCGWAKLISNITFWYQSVA